MRRLRGRGAWLLGAALALGGCVSQPPLSALHATAERLELVGGTVAGLGFSHVVFLDRAPMSVPGGRLHVYIDGDGMPWRGRGRPAADPTPRNPLVLRLMARDPRPGLYLGRPCHGHGALPANCHPWHWTHGRYGEAVVASLAHALGRVAEDLGAGQLVLIGYSGGGTLAMLLAPRLEAVTAVVTVAGNLDVAAWTRHHGYSALSGSLDPAAAPPLPARILQLHWAGAEDREVPPDLTRGALRRQAAGAVEVLPEVDHRCCWERHWPGILTRLEELTAPGGGARLPVPGKAAAGSVVGP